MMISSTTETWRALLADLLATGVEVSPTSLGADWKGRANLELLGYRTRIDLARPVVLCPGRFPGGRGYRFMAAEAAWILSGDNRLATIAPYARALGALSDDGRTLAGAYGPPFVDQVPYVVRALTADRWSRQAVMTIWRPRPQLGGADVPCTVAIQWMIRPRPSSADAAAVPGSLDELHCFATMRSSDTWTGIVFDWFTFAAMSAFVALALRPTLGPLALGHLTLSAASQHLYLVDRDAARACAARAAADLVSSIAPLELEDLSGPDDLVEHLWSTARRTGVYHGSWLHELMEIG